MWMPRSSRNGCTGGSMKDGHTFEYDAERNILFAEDIGDIGTREDVDDFFGAYLRFFEKLGKKVYLVANIDNLLVHAAIADYYGDTALKTAEEHVLGLARWGSNDRARMTVRTTSLKAGMTPNIYETRDEAIEAIRKMQQGSEEPGPVGEPGMENGSEEVDGRGKGEEEQ